MSTAQACRVLGTWTQREPRGGHLRAQARGRICLIYVTIAGGVVWAAVLVTFGWYFGLWFEQPFGCWVRVVIWVVVWVMENMLVWVVKAAVIWCWEGKDPGIKQTPATTRASDGDLNTRHMRGGSKRGEFCRRQGRRVEQAARRARASEKRDKRRISVAGGRRRKKERSKQRRGDVRAGCADCGPDAARQPRHTAMEEFPRRQLRRVWRAARRVVIGVRQLLPTRHAAALEGTQ
eukprot:366457-Chlamydomonas_euryale.AAC.10